MNMQSLVPLAQNPSLIPLFLYIPLTFRFSQNPKPRWRSLCWERRLFKKFRTVLSLSRHKYLYFANQSLNTQSSVYYLYRCPRSKFSQAPSLICYWRMDNFGHIEQDIIIEILSRLPVKSLLRFKCVCKSWLSTITSSSFVYEHFNMALDDCKKAQVLIRYYNSDTLEDVFCLFTNDQLKAPTYLRLHAKPKRHFKVMEPCNGLLFLYDFSSDELFLWNLATKEIKDIPEPPIPPDVECLDSVSFGFGFDRKTRDYKVVRLLKKDCIEENNDYHIHVYTLSSNSWRKLDVVLPALFHIYIIFHGISAYSNGIFYWWSDTVIICFDMSNEQFGVIDLPKIVFPLVEGTTERDGYLTEYNGMLAVIYWLVNEKYETWFELWKMNGHGTTVTWTKQFSVGWLEVWLRPVGTFKNNRILFLNRDEKNTIIPYDHETRSLQIPLPVDSEIKIQCAEMKTIAVFYTESLVSVGEG